MFSPAGHWLLQGGMRLMYSGRLLRQEPVWLASEVPTSSVMAKGFCMVVPD